MKKLAVIMAALGALAAVADGGGAVQGDVEMLPSAFDGKTPVVVETDAFKLVINPDATAQSLVIKATGEECLASKAGLPVFASVQKRPFNNETRLVQMAKRTMYPANRIRRDGDILRIGFDTAPYEVEVRVRERTGYAAFELVRLISNNVQEKQYGGLAPWQMDVPPVEEFRLLQLPVIERKNFGDWLNVEWDDHAAVAVVGATPYMDVDHEKRGDWRLLRADALSGIGHGITNGVAAIAAGAGKEALLAQIEAMENDYDLPRGVASRRNPLLNASIYWTSDISIHNVDEHVANMKKGGFRMALLYYSGMFLNEHAYTNYGDYDLNPERFPNGYDDLKAVLAKIKAAGVTPGFHTLQTFIGFKSRYVTPEADPRLNVKRYFALEQPLPGDGATCDVYVAQNPVDAPMHPKCRVLKFGTELMHYEGYTTTPPYKFTGVERGYFGTTVKAHGRGDGGGILDVCECTATSCCIDQNTSLQDEIADKIAKVYDCGMEFLYFDGSEDVNVPCNVNISLSQWKVARHCGKMPFFTEGCAKTHFGWHLQSGANAFDVFSPEVFKEKIIEYPYQAAQRLAKDFTRVDFGWWGIRDKGPKSVGTQPDMWEYGTSKAAAFDCPATMQMNLHRVHANGRMDDLFETVRRWEDVRARKWLTPEQKEMLKDPKREFHLYLNDKGGYELVEWKQLDVAGGKWTDVRAFIFERNGRRVVAYWHVHDRARLVFAEPLDGTKFLDAAGMKYFETALPAETVRAAFASAAIHGIPTDRRIEIYGFFDDNDGHIQGMCTDGKYIYLTQQSWIYKVDRQGKLVRKIKTPKHTGDVCFHDERIYASSIHYQGEHRGHGIIRVYDTDLNLLKEKMLEKCGLDGITWLDGYLYVGGGAHKPTIPHKPGEAPETKTPHFDNNLFKVDPDTLEIVERHVLNHGSKTCYGIQNATTDGKLLYFCYYVPGRNIPNCIVYDKSMRVVRTLTFEAGKGSDFGQGFDFVGAVPGGNRFLRVTTQNAWVRNRRPEDVFTAIVETVEIRDSDVPPRHVPKRIMGRDYWPALYRYRDWLPDAKYDNSAFEVRFDNPDIFKLPAFRDAAPVYWAHNNPPPVDGASGTWRRFADNFRDTERDREIADSNPFPDRPFLFAATAKRQFWTWGAECDLDYADFAEWRAQHPNALYSGTILEWDNDLMLAYRRMASMTDKTRRAKVEALIGKCPPKTREERMDVMRRQYADRHKAAYGDKMAVHASHVFSQHLGGDCGADVLVVETTNTSGSPTNDSEYRWNLAPMFVRGAARQFDRLWEWYWAAYMNGFSTNGEWQNDAACRYPIGPSANTPFGAINRPEYGISGNLMRRLYYFSYLNGANVTQPEEWSAYFLAWDEGAGKTMLTCRGRDYAAYHDFTAKHPGRGTPYTPVAICIPLSRGYTAFGGWPWAENGYGYTRSDLMSDAVLFSLVPGFERAKAMKAGVETNLHNSRFAQMYDVICPDAPSQSPETVLDVMKSYKALIMAGEFADPKVAQCLAEYEKSGGRVIVLSDDILQNWSVSTTDHTEDTEKRNGGNSNSVCSVSYAVTRQMKAGKVKFPKIESILENLQKDYFPFKVKGDCLYGANRTEDGWWLWVFNNKDITKFTDAPHAVDHSFDADITVSCKKDGTTAVKELLTEKPVPIAEGKFKYRVEAGDLAVFEVRGRTPLHK